MAQASRPQETLRCRNRRDTPGILVAESDTMSIRVMDTGVVTTTPVVGIAWGTVRALTPGLAPITMVRADQVTTMGGQENMHPQRWPQPTTPGSSAMVPPPAWTRQAHHPTTSTTIREGTTTQHHLWAVVQARMAVAVCTPPTRTPPTR